MKEKIIIFGTGGHSKVILDIVTSLNKYEPHAFVSLNKALSSFEGLRHLHQNNFLELGIKKGIVAIGDNYTRHIVVKYILDKCSNFEFITLIHPSSVIGSTVEVGVGTVVMANSVINTSSIVGRHSIINTSASIDHDCRIGEFSSVGPGAILGGNVTTGHYSTICLGASIIHGINIGNDTVIGAGSLVLDNVKSNTLAYGTPCVEVRRRDREDKYL